MKLVSDFHNYYDIWFDSNGEIFQRLSTVGPTRSEQFKILTKIGCKIPPIGKVKNVLCSMWWEEDILINEVVVYEDETKHCCEGKYLSKWVTNGNKDKLCSAFLAKSNGVSFRKLQIGHRAFWLEYKSYDSWMSNYGNGEVNIIGEEKVKNYTEYPLFAIDFILGKEMYAVDFNIAPGVPNVLCKNISGKEVVKE